MDHPPPRRLPRLLLLAAAGAATAAAWVPQDDGIELYEAKIRPLLLSRCAECHGPEKQKAKMRLDSPAGIRKGSDFGPVIVPGDLDGSTLIEAVRYQDEFLQMPPKGKLVAAEIALLEEWVAMGAPMPAGAAAEAPESGFDLEARKQHWSFWRVAAVEPPAVGNEGWPLSPVDRFVLARIEAAGLEPAPEVPRSTWLRRVTFDVTGLPPTPEELDAFESDESPDAYERVVDRLLASSAYGERWARHWLDLVRYADTRGHEFDYITPNAYQYRDYVIRALNEDVPYDRFVLEHFAGDLLEDPRPNPDHGWDESILGTGFWFLGEEMHSPVSIRGDEVERIASQVDVAAKAFQGLTLACARCHDHKFDAITQEDFYAFSGFPLSSSYRQVRFETRERNAKIAEELEALAERHAPAVSEVVASSLAAEVEGLAPYLVAAGRIIGGEPADVDPAELAADVDLLVEDFEGDLARWIAEGDAFGVGPLRVEDLAGSQRDTGARGSGLINTHNVRDGDGVRHEDALTGALTSEPFALERDYLHFLIGGGSHDGTRIELAVGDEVVHTASGTNSNRLQHRAWDVREWRGRSAVLRIVDEVQGGWGNVGIDHIVLSDRDGPEALAVERGPAELALEAARVQRFVTDGGLERERLELWIGLLRGAKDDEQSPLRGWWHGGRPSEGRESAKTRTIVDYALGDGSDWIQEGFAFSAAPVRALDVVLAAEGDLPFAAIAELGGAYARPVWSRLARAPGTELYTGRLDWDQAGRMLRTPTFELEEGKLHYLVRGKGSVYAAVDSHRLNHGPLHGRLVRKFDTGGRFEWVTHDLSDYVGHRVHLELTPDLSVGTFAVSRIVEAADAPSLGSHELVDWNADRGEIAEELERSLRSVAALVGRGTDPSEAWKASVAEWLIASLWRGGTPERVAEVLAPLRDEQSKRLASVEPVSHTALAMLDGSGVDEYLLLRGNAMTPGDPAARRFLEALAGPESLAPSRGSGRLELALQIADPRNPFTARVAVNRVWHHLFGRGIVPSCDDFGVMGDEPTHPELLDWLARRFVDDAWSSKRLIRELVLSRTYRTSTLASAEAVELDPKNELLSHARVRRLSAEAIRDSILAVAGELDRRMYGPAVPIHLTEFMQGRGRPGRSGPLDGDGRRSIYLSVRRNFLVPMLAVFDFPAPAATIGRRSVSNVPAQALTLMNDPFVVLEARRWAERVLAVPGDAHQRIEGMYRRAYGRTPSDYELQSALRFLERQQDRHSPEEAELLAWADFAHVLFNVKEFVFLD